MTTILDKDLKRQITVGDAEYVVVIGPDGMRVVGKGKRKPEVQLSWSDLLSGEAALAVALNASLGKKAPPAEERNAPSVSGSPHKRSRVASNAPAKKRTSEPKR